MKEEEAEHRIRRLEGELARRPDAGGLEELVLMFCASAKLSRDPRRLRYVVALAELDPKNRFLSTPAVIVDPSSDPAMFRYGVELWQRRLQEEPDSASVAISAATFFCSDTRLRGRRVLEEFDGRAPGIPSVLVALAQFAEGPETRLRYLKRAAEAGSEAPNLPVWIAGAALEARDFETAATMAQWLVVDSADSEIASNWGRENRRRSHWHWAQTTIGALAVERGDLEAAVRSLHQSLKLEPSVQMRSYGPSMHLARALCERGAFEAVAVYLQACRRFWPDPVLEEWIDQVSLRKVPDFLANGEAIEESRS